MEIYNKDCLKWFDETKLNKSVDMVLVDIPYQCTSCKWDTQIDLKKMWVGLDKVCSDKCIYAFFCNTKLGVKLILSNPKMYRYDIVWEKALATGFLGCNKRPLRKHEMIYIFYKNGVGPKTYNPQKTKGEPFQKKGANVNHKSIYGTIKNLKNANITGDRHPTSIIKFHVKKRGFHPSQKPILLCEWLIKTYSNEGNTVLDFTMGAGSTGLGCINTNRKFIGIEKNKNFFEVARKRLNSSK